MAPLFQADWPVFAVSWSDAIEYARWYTRRRGRGLWGFRLPTEDEWEKAARGVDGRWFPWGDRFDEGFCAMESSRPGARLQPEPVGLFPADESPYGVRDMAGGMRSWTASDSADGAWKIVKGGSWRTPPAWSRAATRDGAGEFLVGNLNGLRLAATLVRPGD